MRKTLRNRAINAEISPYSPTYAITCTHSFFNIQAKELTVIGEINARQPSPIDRINILTELHTRRFRLPNRNREHECKISTTDWARLTIDNLRRARGNCNRSEKTLTKRRRRRREERIPAPIIRVRNARRIIIEESCDVQSRSAEDIYGVSVWEGDGELAAVGAGGDVLEGSDLVDALDDVAVSVGVLGDEEFPAGGHGVGPDVCGIGLIELLEEGWNKGCAAARGNVGWCRDCAGEPQEGEESEGCS